MKEIFPRLFGNEKLKSTLGCEILNGKQSHAYIIEGAGKSGKMTAALSAADEIAVSRFLAGDIRFTDIPRLVEAAVDASPDLPCDALQNVWAADAAARKFAQSWKP